MSNRVNLLALARITPAERAQIEAVGPRIHLVEAGGWFDGEIRDTWPHQRPARASNLKAGELWGSNVLVTASRRISPAAPWPM